MQPISFARHQFPPEIIQHATWLSEVVPFFGTGG
jgi:hypothetical protein